MNYAASTIPSDWEVRLARAARTRCQALPGRVLTAPASFCPAGLAPEIAMLLPAARYNQDLAQAADALAAAGGAPPGTAAGVFLVDPFLRLSDLAGQLRRAGVDWVVNLPSVSQFDDEFAVLLGDVAMDFAHECAMLTACRAAGLGAVAALSDSRQTEAALACAPAAIAVVPNVRAYRAGTPAPTALSRTCRAVKARSRAVGADIPVLVYATSATLENEGLWPVGADGVLIPPGHHD